jgi:hypothetical protein
MATVLVMDIARTRRKGQSKFRRETQRPVTKMAVLLIIVYVFIAIDVFAHSVSIRWVKRIKSYACPLLMARLGPFKPGGYFMYQQV